MGHTMSEPLGEEKRLKKIIRKRRKCHHTLKTLKKEDTGSNIHNTLQTSGLFEHLLQELDNEQNLDNLVNTLKMLVEKILDLQKDVEEMRESSVILQREKENELGEVVSQNLLQENKNESGDINDEANDIPQDGITVSVPKADAKKDYKEIPSPLVVNSDNVQDGIEDSVTKAGVRKESHDEEISSPLVINKNTNSKYAGGVIFVGDNNTYQINEADLSRNMEKEADDKLMEIMRKKLFALRTSNTRLELENRILRRRSIDTADHGRRHIFQLERDRRLYPSQRSNSFPSRTVSPSGLR